MGPELLCYKRSPILFSPHISWAPQASLSGRAISFLLRVVFFNIVHGSCLGAAQNLTSCQLSEPGGSPSCQSLLRSGSFARAELGLADASRREICEHRVAGVKSSLRMAHAKPPRCNSAAPSPRIFIYENLHRVPGGAPSETGVPRNLLPPPNLWRNSRHVTDWVRASAHNELDGDCADYFLLPGYPPNRFGEGDLGIARLFDHIRQTWPYWNRTVAAGTARHLWMLPCDHGPGDCGYDRPLLPNKYSTERPRCTAGPSQRCSTSARAEIERLWGGGRWEQLNPASPERLVISLQFNGWADYYRGQNGHCVSCFAHGLDVRLPTPESHLCGPLCGLHRRANATVTARQLLRTLAYWGGITRCPPSPPARARRRRRAAAGCSGTARCAGATTAIAARCSGSTARRAGAS